MKENYHAIISCALLTVPLLNRLNQFVEQSSAGAFIGFENPESDLVIPCDGWVEIVDDSEGVECLVLEGSAGPSGFGYAKVVIPLKDAGGYLLDISFDEPMPEFVRDLALKTIERKQ
jgi:hypothetical protein